MAPSYVNIFMDDLERWIFANTDRALTTWWRDIDDIFAIWPHSEEHLTIFLEGFNKFTPSIKFTTEWSSMSWTRRDIWSLTFMSNQQILISTSTGIAATPATEKMTFLISQLSGSTGYGAGRRIIYKGWINWRAFWQTKHDTMRMRYKHKLIRLPYLPGMHFHKLKRLKHPLRPSQCHQACCKTCQHIKAVSKFRSATWRKYTI